MTLFIGIDVGLSGAWAIVDHDGAYVDCGDMPKNDKRVHVRELWVNMGKAIAGRDIGHIAVELVHAMPGQGVTSMFNFGRAVGAVESLVDRFLCPYSMVTPQAWKKHAGLSKTEKDAARVKAAQKWPSAPLARKKDCGRADALWLADYAREMEA